MRIYLVMITALLLAVVLTPALRMLAFRTGSLDQPGHRKVHGRPIPVLGGVAIYIAVIGAVLFWGDRFYVGQAAGILIGATVISFTGFWDDRVSLGPGVKLIFQLVASILVVSTGTTVELFELQAINILITILWIIGVSNAFNLLDNMDGLSAGIASIASAFFLLLAILNGQILVAILCAALLGGCLGFLLYNINPASIFMGDAGSLFIGFLIATSGIKLRFPGNTILVTWMVPILILAVPLFDTLLVVVARLKEGRSIAEGGTDHVSHRLVAKGMSHKGAVTVIYGVGLVCGIIGLLLSTSPVETAYTSAAIILMFCIVAFRFLLRSGIETQVT